MQVCAEGDGVVIRLRDTQTHITSHQGGQQAKGGSKLQAGARKAFFAEWPALRLRHLEAAQLDYLVEHFAGPRRLQGAQP